jgi:Zn finger protein HypA/HybF involved in hydrogenase expression
MSDSDLLEVRQPINPEAASVDVACPHCHSIEEFHASAWSKQNPHGRFTLSPIHAYGVTCAGCRNDFCFKLTPAAHPWPSGPTRDVTCPDCQHTVTTHISVIRMMDGECRPDTCDKCGADFEVYADGRVVKVEYEQRPTARTPEQIMQYFQGLEFDPNGARDWPFTTEVEILLTVPVLRVFDDGTLQFMDDDAVELVYSPRLDPEALERFCEANIETYRAFHDEHETALDRRESVPLTPFW